MKRIALTIGIFMLTFTVAAGERLPYGMLVHASAKSLTTAIENLDTLVAACIEDTPLTEQFQPGMPAMLIGMFAPLPQGVWDPKNEIHAALVVTSPMNPQPVVIVKTTGLAAFKKAMADGDIPLEGDGTKMSARLPMTGQTWYFADVGSGRLACAMNEAARDFAVKVMASGWSPRHTAATELSFNTDMKNLLAAYRPIIDAGLAQFKEQFDMDGERMKKLPESLKPLATALAGVLGKIFQKVEGDIPALNNLGLDLSLADQRLKLTFSLSSDNFSELDMIRAAYYGKGRQKYTLASSLPERTIVFDASSDLSILPEGMMELWVESIRAIAEAVMPESVNELTGLPREFQALGIKDYTAGVYSAGDKPVTAVYFECAKPQEFLAFIVKTVKLSQAVTEKLFTTATGKTTPAIAVRYEPDAGMFGAVPYHRVAIEITTPEAEAPKRYELLFTVGKKIVIAVFGQVEESDLWYAIANYQGTTGEFVYSGSFINSEPVKKTLGAIDNRQLKVMTLSPLEAVASIFVWQTAMNGGDVDAAKAAVAEIEAGPTQLALGIGATNKAMTMEVVLPAEIVNDFIKNAEIISRLRE